MEEQRGRVNWVRIVVLSTVMIGIILLSRLSKDEIIELKNNTEPSVVHVINEDSGEVEIKGTFSMKNQLVTLKFDKDGENPREIKDGFLQIYTYHERYIATEIEEGIVYIGEPPTDTNPISSISYEEVESKTINKSELGEMENSYILKVRLDGVSTISLVSDSGGFIPIDIVDGYFVMTVSETIYDKTTKFTLNITKNIRLDI